MTCCCWLTDHIRLADNTRKLYGHDNNHPHPPFFQRSAIQTSRLRTAHHLAAVPPYMLPRRSWPAVTLNVKHIPCCSKPRLRPHSNTVSPRHGPKKGYVPPDCSRCNCGCAHSLLDTAATAAAVVPEFPILLPATFSAADSSCCCHQRRT